MIFDGSRVSIRPRSLQSTKAPGVSGLQSLIQELKNEDTAPLKGSFKGSRRVMTGVEYRGLNNQNRF